MITGINQNVRILGREFHVQTEISSTDDEHQVRTRVYVAGRIIGSRDLSMTTADEDEVREAMQQQHDTIIDNMTTRLEEMAAAKQAAPPAAEPEAAPQKDRQPKRITKVSRPVLEEIPGVRSSVQVRRLIAGFRNSTDLSPPVDAEALAQRLSDAAHLIRDIIDSTTFNEVRLDEQVRFNDLLDRIDGCLAGPADPDNAVNVWSQVATFSIYLGKVNNRTDLVAFDRRLVMWGLSSIGQEGMSDELLEHLGWIYGRDLAFDKLIDDPPSVNKDNLTQALMGLLDSI